MATQAAISVARAVGYGQTKFDFVLTVSNTGASAINYVSGSVSVQSPGTPTTDGCSATTVSIMPPQSASLQLAATTGTLNLPFTMTFNANIQPQSNPVPAQYNVSAFVSMSDGTVASSNTLSITVIPVQAPISSAPSIYPPVIAIPGQYPELPASGHTSLPATYGWSADFYDNLMSGLMAAIPACCCLY